MLFCSLPTAQPLKFDYSIFPVFPSKFFHSKIVVDPSSVRFWLCVRRLLSANQIRLDWTSFERFLLIQTSLDLFDPLPTSDLSAFFFIFLPNSLFRPAKHVGCE
uniref:Ovule protein n=1 Tax=Bursaphelenchus xylophilus TaxID=6326 RepID=A0A1I7SH91_BURXY